MRMDAAAFSLLGYPKVSSFLLEENVLRLAPIASYKMLSFKSTNSITIESLSLKSVIPNRALKEDDWTHKSSDVKSRNREKLIALFKRIQTSISQGKTTSMNKKSSQASNHDSSPETSVLEFLQQSSRETKGVLMLEVRRSNSKAKRNEESTEKRAPKKEKQSPLIPQLQSEFKLTREPSNFVKKSPIPSPTPLRSNSSLELNKTEVTSSQVSRVLSQIEGMKLSELKEVAKERGIRGYSKLKKSELLQLLRSHQVNV